MDNYNKELEKNLLEIVKQKEEADKRLLNMEIVTGIICVLIMLALIVVAAYAPLEEWVRTTLLIISFLPLLIATPFMLKIEQKAGYYECRECRHRYVPEYNSVFWAMHMGRTRYMKCPKCEKKSWQKKVISKD